ELSLDRRTVLLKLHGAVDPFPEREWESFVITEDDYIDYLGRSDVASSVPLVGRRPRPDAARVGVLAPLRDRRARRRARRVRRAPRQPSRERGVNVKSPYRGLAAFEDSELDALYFFGRERDTEIVVANLIASRFTVLYGPSGVGKSSLLLAAVARTLRELPEEPVVVVF